MKTCPDCNGDGVIEKGTDEEQQCPTCGGSGFVPDEDHDEEEEATRTAVGMRRKCTGTSTIAVYRRGEGLYIIGR